MIPLQKSRSCVPTKFRFKYSQRAANSFVNAIRTTNLRFHNWFGKLIIPIGCVFNGEVALQLLADSDRIQRDLFHDNLGVLGIYVVVLMKFLHIRKNAKDQKPNCTERLYGDAS